MDIVVWQCRANDTFSPAAHHRINPENAYFYRANANSKIAVTLKVTPVVAAEEGALTRPLSTCCSRLDRNASARDAGQSSI